MQKLNLSHFLKTKYKVSKILYSELSAPIKIGASIVFIFSCPQKNITSILLYNCLLILILTKVKNNHLISYNKFSSKVILIKCLTLICILMLRIPSTIGTKSGVTENCSPNIITILSYKHQVIKTHFFQKITNFLYYDALKSIYRIEIVALFSLLITQILLYCIAPEKILGIIKKQTSKLQLMFSFALQVSYLIINQIKKLSIAFKIREIKYTSQDFNNTSSIIRFIYLYAINSKNTIKKEAIESTQLNRNKAMQTAYPDFSDSNLLIKTNQLIITYILAGYIFFKSI
nr:hypothetical protein [Porphyropsis coccinea]